ncbi:MAG: hypothetical protein MGG11_22420 [Trichodesmium sp. MAG_R03]|nr:hypothetical protein [Trichodesmium sp. MAG_R03]
MRHFTYKITQGFGIRLFQILIFLSLFTIAKPSLSYKTVDCANIKIPTVDIINSNGNKTQLCLTNTKPNQHGTIYKIGIIEGGDVFTFGIIYRGKSGDAMMEDYSKSPEPIKTYGTWRQSGQKYIFQFSSGMKIYIPVEN